MFIYVFWTPIYLTLTKISYNLVNLLLFLLNMQEKHTYTAYSEELKLARPYY